MRLIKIGLANINSTVGAVTSNTDACIHWAHELSREKVTVGIFPEQVIGGYMMEDLVQWNAFVAKQHHELDRFCKATCDLPTVFVLGITIGIGGDLFNVAAVTYRGKVIGYCPKEKLPTYNVFYEARTFSRGIPNLALSYNHVICGDQIFQFDFGTIAVEVCEDLWSPDGPMRRRCYSGAELVCNISASPYRAGIVSTRREIIATRSSDNQATIAYCNLVGANDGLVFDGGGFVYQNGRPVFEAKRFCEGITTTVVDLDRTIRNRREASTWRNDLEDYRKHSPNVNIINIAEKTYFENSFSYPKPSHGTTYFLPHNTPSASSPRDELLDDLFEVIALGVADYFRKNKAFSSIGLALSGGRDSLLTLLIAWRALRIIFPTLDDASFQKKLSETLYVFSMPSCYSSEETKQASEQIAKDLGAHFETVSIHDSFIKELEVTQNMLSKDTLITELTRQNIQARIRGTRMWNWANSSGALFLQTGNMSEKAVGYTTIGGDLEGALSVIANVPKTVVIAMLERLYQRFQFDGIRQTLSTMPGPELAENQSGEHELMPYEILDACLYLYASEKLSCDELTHALPGIFPNHAPVQLAEWARKFVRLFTRSIYKWVQSPIAIHVGSLDLDRERALQLPVVQQQEWQ